MKKVADEQQKQAQMVKSANNLPVITLKPIADAWSANKIDEGYLVTGKKIERFAAKTDFNSDIGRQRIKDIMLKMGILNHLRKGGINDGDKIIIGQPKIGEIDY